MGEPVSDETARTLRRAWFDYLDTIEPLRPKLHAYCLKLTGSIFDAEDLVQEALLKGFGAIGRGDFFNRGQPAIQSARAYLSRIATNLWLDAQRRERRQSLEAAPDQRVEAGGESVITRAAGAALFERTAPRERAAVVLKDVFDFSLAEIAAILSTTEGAVKSALHRGRSKLSAAHGFALAPRGAPAPAALIDRFIAAFAAHDLAAVTALLSETCIYEPRGVGGEIGKDGIWVRVNIDRPPNVASERRRLEGEDVVVGVLTRRSGRKVLLGVSRLEEAGGLISRHVSYFFTPETLALAADALGMDAANHGYHQDPATLERMIADSNLAWQGL